MNGLSNESKKKEKTKRRKKIISLYIDINQKKNIKTKILIAIYFEKPRVRFFFKTNRTILISLVSYPYLTTNIYTYLFVKYL